MLRIKLIGGDGLVKKIFRGTFTILGLMAGYIIAQSVVRDKHIVENSYFSNIIIQGLFFIVMTLGVGLILFFISPFIYKHLKRFITYMENGLSKLSASEVIFGVIGAAVGILVASVFTIPLNYILTNMANSVLGSVALIGINFIAMLVGIDLAIKKKDDILIYLENFKKNTPKEKKGKVKVIPKILDTSVIIDGRIFDICQTGFVEGPLVIPSFVLDELRHVSDCSDSLKRIRGRRGLDILNKIQKELPIEVQIWEGDFPEIAEVDSKLLKLTQKLDGKVLTNDYNLNKVAEVQGVTVLNIIELSNAIKPVVLPGEDMRLTIVKDGKESGQGIAYLDDGTMIVVEGGRKYMGEEIDVTVTSVLQTAAGRMIFAKQKG